MSQNRERILKKDNRGIPHEKTVTEFHARLAQTGINHDNIRRFRNIIYRFYRKNARDLLPWRNTNNPYHILVSEIMLQQTQIERVLHKYPLLIRKFPDFQVLARSPLRSLYAVWHGMGYNRRALALKNIACTVMDAPYNGRLPSAVEELMRLPGVGRATAGAVAAFAFHQPVVFIETNIRRVFIHFFFPGKDRVSDVDILPLVEKTLDVKDPRRWYYALMDYGSMLRRLAENPNRKSAHYQKQQPFSGSNRQMRGLILRLLMDHSALSRKNIAKKLHRPGKIIYTLIDQLHREGFIKKRGNQFRMA